MSDVDDCEWNINNPQLVRSIRSYGRSANHMSCRPRQFTFASILFPFQYSILQICSSVRLIILRYSLQWPSVAINMEVKLHNDFCSLSPVGTRCGTYKSLSKHRWCDEQRKREKCPTTHNWLYLSDGANTQSKCKHNLTATTWNMYGIPLHICVLCWLGCPCLADARTKVSKECFSFLSRENHCGLSLRWLISVGSRLDRRIARGYDWHTQTKLFTKITSPKSKRK